MLRVVILLFMLLNEITGDSGEKVNQVGFSRFGLTVKFPEVSVIIVDITGV